MRPARRTSALIGAVTAVGSLGLASCSDDGPEAGEARFSIDGEARVERPDGDQEVVTGSGTLARGDLFVVTAGTAELDFPGRVTVELRAAREPDDRDAAVVIGETPQLEAGDLLVAAPDRFTVQSEGTDIVLVAGAARISRSIGVSVATYRGTVELDSASVERDVPAYREIQVPTLGRPPSSARPIQIDESDPWDRRFLGTAIDLGARLDALAAGYTANLAVDQVQTVQFFRNVAPVLESEARFTDALLADDREPGEALVGAVITALGRRGSFEDRWDEVFGFRDAGASWGLVALDQGVSPEPLVEAVQEAVSSSPLEFASPSPVVAPSGGSSNDGPSPTTTSTVPPTTNPPPPSSSPTTTVPEGDDDVQVAPLLDPLFEPTTEALGGLVGGLLNALLPAPEG